MSAAGLYIHIPFCMKKCRYCGFYSTTSVDMLPAFINALLQEMGLCKHYFKAFDTVYIGGGTPSLLSMKYLEKILEAAAKNFSLASQAEVTIETNPSDIDLSSLRDMRGLGINRLNIGIQSFDDDILKFLGRRHDRSHALSAIRAADKAGFENIGMDLIYDIPGQDRSSWLETLHLALSFHPAHLSCYQLTFEQGTPMSTALKNGEFFPPDEEELADLFFLTSDTISKAGYIHYEVSNFARNEELKSRHNQKYWDHTSYLGLGPGAHSFDGRRRWWNHSSLTAYIADLENQVRPVAASENLTDEQLQLEAIFLGLRTINGFNLDNLKNGGKHLLTTKQMDMVYRLNELGLLQTTEGFLKPTLAGMAVADSLALIMGEGVQSFPAS